MAPWEYLFVHTGSSKGRRARQLRSPLRQPTLTVSILDLTEEPMDLETAIAMVVQTGPLPLVAIATLLILTLITFKTLSTPRVPSISIDGPIG